MKENLFNLPRGAYGSRSTRALRSAVQRKRKSRLEEKEMLQEERDVVTTDRSNSACMLCSVGVYQPDGPTEAKGLVKNQHGICR